MNRTTIAVLVAVFAVSATAVAKDTAIAFDSVTTPGRAVPVGAKFERTGWQFWRPDIRNKQVAYRVLGRTIVSRTDDSGTARVSVTPTSAGVFPIEGRLEGSSLVSRGRLFSIDPARPCAIIDLDQTVCDMAQWLVPLRGASAPAFPGAVRVLADLSRTHAIIYLTARDQHLDGLTREFLRRNGFPDGPVLFNDLGLETAAERDQLDSKNHGRFKLAVLRQLQGRGVNPVLGIGNTTTDAFAYEGAGLDSYIFDTPAVPAPVPPPSARFSSYEPGLRALLVRDGHLRRSFGIAGSLAGTP